MTPGEQLWLSIRDVTDYDETVRMIDAALSNARLEEAKWWRDWYNQPDNSSQFEHDRGVKRIAELQAAAPKPSGASEEEI